MGGALYSKPKFTSFGDPRLEAVFRRPSVGTAAYYHLALSIAVPTLFSTTFGASMIALSLISFRRSSLSFRSWCYSHYKSFKHFWSRTRAAGTQKSQLLQVSYTFLLASTGILILTIACLLELSILPDHDITRE